MPLLIALLLACQLLAPASARAEQGIGTAPPEAGRTHIVAVVASDLPPTFFTDPATGRPAGFAIDVMDEVARRAGLQVQYVYGKPWDEMQQMILDGRADVLPSLIINDARLKQFLFTDPVETMPINYLVRASDSTSTAPRPGMKIGMIRASTAEGYLGQRADLQLATYESMHNLLMELLAGRLDMVMTATPNIRKLASDAGVDDRIRVIEPPVLEGKRAIALHPDAAALQQRLNQVIDGYIGSTHYQALYAKWWGKPAPFWTVRRVVLAMGLLLGVVVAGLLAWRFVGITRLNRRLRSEVAERAAANQRLQQAIATAEELAESARRANLAKSEFLANMSHELRTPFTGVLGMLEVLGGNLSEVERRECLAAATKSGWNLLQLLDDILDLSRIEVGQLQLTPGNAHLADLAHSVSSLFALQAQQKGLQIQVSVDPRLPPTIRSDERRLRQILLNLVGNAIKFSSSGTIGVQLTENGLDPAGRSRLQIRVSDQGVGIAPEQVQRMFEPFEQGDSSYRKHFQGAGLGLTIVKRLVDAMGGTLRIESRPGFGTQVLIDLAVEALAAAASNPAAAAVALHDAPSRPGLRILLAEDNAENSKLLCLLLRNQHHEVTAVENGREALEKLAVEPYDLVLMDIQMPVMDGLEALRQIRAGNAGVLDPAVPVVALTAYAMAGDRERFLEAGMDDFIAKPIRMNRLQEVLQHYMVRPAYG